MTDRDQSDVEGAEVAVEEDDMEIEFFLREDHFAGIDHSATFSALKTWLSCKHFQKVSASTLDGASTMDFGEREEGSISTDNKFMSLDQRWFSKKESKYLKGESVMEVNKCTSHRKK